MCSQVLHENGPLGVATVAEMAYKTPFISCKTALSRRGGERRGEHQK